MLNSSSDRNRLVASLFRDSLEVIHSTLVSLYGVPSDDATRLEEELLAWFDRFARRPGTLESLPGLRPHLVSMACKIGHVYWSGKTESEQPRDESARRSLALGPEIIAIEIESRLGVSPEGNGERR